ncbi:hypothetical protein [Anaerosporobacter sp.]
MNFRKIALLVACTVTFTSIQPVAVTKQSKAAEITNEVIKTLEVASAVDISSDANNFDTAYTYYPTDEIVNGTKDVQENIFKFTLDQTSYVTLAAKYDTVKYNFQSNVYTALSSSETFASTILEWEAWSNGESKNGTALLEAGTYYIKIKTVYTGDVKDRYSKENGGYTTVGVVAQPITRTKDSQGNTLKNAINLTADTYSVGLTSVSYKKQYFKFKLSKKSDITVKVAQSCPTNLDLSENNIELLDSDGMRVENSATLKVNKDTVSLNYTLEPGTYYILATATSNDKTAAAEINVKYTVNKTYKSKIGTLKVSNAKRGTSTISGKSIASANITVTLNGKTYKTKTSKTGSFKVTVKSKLKKGTKIKVTATKSGFTKKTITYTVK